MQEEPLFRADPVEIYWKYEGLTDEQRKEYKKLSCWFGIEDQRVPAIFTTNRFVPLKMTQILWDILTRILPDLRLVMAAAVFFLSRPGLTTLVTLIRLALTVGTRIPTN